MAAAPKGNKFALGNKGGRPPYYDKLEDLEIKVNEYFDYCEGEYEEKEGIRTITTGKGENKTTTTETYTYTECLRSPETPSITGLALFIGFSSKDSLYDYIKKDEFSDCLKRAVLVIENEYERGLWNDRPTGAIFALKNMGWRDRHEIDHTTKGESMNQINLGTGEQPEDD